MIKRAKKIWGTFTRVGSKLRNPWWKAKCNYIKYYDSLPIDEHSILLESQHGREINGNIFYLIRYLSQSDKYKDYKIYLCARAGKVKCFENVLKFYGLNNVRITVLSSEKYFQILSSAKYLINDNTFLPFFIKKEGQVYLNTWHGTPLKSLGRQIKNDAHAIGNTQKNFVSADYLLFPNQHTRTVMLRDYMIENIANGSYIMGGYPRNEAFFDEDRKKRIKETLQLKEKKVYAYMPTFRGTAHEGGTSKNTYYLNYYLYELDKGLQDDEVFYVNLHPVANKNVDFKQFKHIKSFPKNYETYDFLSATDVLVTDYSSVFFDYAALHRKIVLFTYDKEEYLADRGMYMSVDHLPFPQVSNVIDLLHALRSEKDYDDQAFIDEYCKYENRFASQKLCDHIILGQDTGINAQRILGNGKENVLLYAGDLAANGITASLRNLLNTIDLEKRNYYFSFYSSKVEKNKTTLFSFPEKANYLAFCGDINLTIKERAIRKLFKKKLINTEHYMHLIKRRIRQNFERITGGAHFDKVVDFNGYEQEVILCFSQFEGQRSIFVHSDMIKEKRVRDNQRLDVLKYAYNVYDKIAIVTEDMRTSTLQISSKASNICLVKNSIDYKNILRKSEKPIQFDSFTKTNMPKDKICHILKSENTEVFINIGRFSPEKGHDRLMNAFKKYSCDHSGAYLLVMGGRSLNNGYRRLQQRAEELGLKESVILIENVSNPYPILKECDYFVLSSYYEGFGLVLAEADILGVPVVSTDIEGPRSFMKKHNGTLVDDSEEGIYQGMLMLHEGSVPPMNVDYEQYNQEVISEFESMLE